MRDAGYELSDGGAGQGMRDSVSSYPGKYFYILKPETRNPRSAINSNTGPVHPAPRGVFLGQLSTDNDIHFGQAAMFFLLQ
jgi:hypothetical protein